MTICKNCKKETKNPKFCSRNCSATFNNKIPKRKLKQRKCKRCNKNIKRIWHKDQRTICRTCIKTKTVDWDNITIEKIRGKRNYQKNSVIRAKARKKMEDKEQKCFICGYSLHTHVCHIKPIKSFSPKTKLSVINADENLIILCPNHHWELDNGHLNFPEFGNLHS